MYLNISRSSVSGCSVPETEDLYCDDELHPSLERNPNMQLFCSPPPIQSSIEFSNQLLFQSMDAGSFITVFFIYNKIIWIKGTVRLFEKFKNEVLLIDLSCSRNKELQKLLLQTGSNVSKLL